MSRARVILPKKLIGNPAAMSRAITNALNMAAKDMQTDFRVTTQTWNTSVDFAIETPSTWERIVGTNSALYGMLNEGTKPHAIFPRRSKILSFAPVFRAKTTPRSISSGSGGSSGDHVVARHVNHPGTEPREWDTVIAQKWDRLFPQLMQRAIDSEAS